MSVEYDVIIHQSNESMLINYQSYEIVRFILTISHSFSSDKLKEKIK